MRVALIAVLAAVPTLCARRPAAPPAAEALVAQPTAALSDGGFPTGLVEPSPVGADGGAPGGVVQAAPVGTQDAGPPATAPPPGPPTQAKRLDFRQGAPIISVGIVDGALEVAFSPRGDMRARLQGEVEKLVSAPARSPWKVRLRDGRPPKVTSTLQLAEVPFEDKAGLRREQRKWERRAIATRTQVVGSVYGISGKVIDNRRYLLLLEDRLDRPAAVERQAELHRSYPERLVLFEEALGDGSGVLELLDGAGTPVALAQDRLFAEVDDGGGFDVRQVEFGMGYAFHSFEDRAYRGSLLFTVGREGKLAVVNLVSLEDHLRGLVPSEIFGSAPAEALKAQAVTARGEVLAKVGTRHLADPYLLCAEQHCAVYRGLTGELPSTNQAVEQTRGEGLFGAEGRLVDSVYSAVCGGHTEHNEEVWGGSANPHLRGRPDVLGRGAATASPKDLGSFLSAELPAACRLASFAQPTKYRWEKRLEAAEVNRQVAHLGVGEVTRLEVLKRGVSGRANALAIHGTQGIAQVRGELTIRRLFGMLNSAMFVVAPAVAPDGRPAAWVFRGGGWGHGVGMCQTGAIGRAEAGQDYQEILRHYFGGAEVARLY